MIAVIVLKESPGCSRALLPSHLPAELSLLFSWMSGREQDVCLNIKSKGLYV